MPSFLFLKFTLLFEMSEADLLLIGVFQLVHLKHIQVKNKHTKKCADLNKNDT